MTRTRVRVVIDRLPDVPLSASTGAVPINMQLDARANAWQTRFPAYTSAKELATLGPEALMTANAT